MKTFLTHFFWLRTQDTNFCQQDTEKLIPRKEKILTCGSEYSELWSCSSKIKA